MKVFLSIFLFLFVLFGTKNCQEVKPSDSEAENDVKPSSGYIAKIPPLIYTNKTSNAELQSEPDRDEPEETSTEPENTENASENSEKSTENVENQPENIPTEPTMTDTEPERVESEEEPETEEVMPRNSDEENPEQPPLNFRPEMYPNQPIIPPQIPGANELFNIRVTAHTIRGVMPPFFGQPRPRESQPTDQMPVEDGQPPHNNPRSRFWSLFEKNNGDNNGYRGESNRILLVTIRDPLEKYTRAQRYVQYMQDQITEMLHRYENLIEEQLNRVENPDDKTKMTNCLNGAKQFALILTENSLFNITKIMAPHVNNPLNTLFRASNSMPSNSMPANSQPTANYAPRSEPYVSGYSYQ